MNENELVFCRHYRKPIGGSIDMLTGKMRREYAPKGGATVVAVRSPVTGRLHIGVSVCSKRDNFCRKSGREAALKRAAQAAALGVMAAYPKCRPMEGFSTRQLLTSLPNWLAQEMLETAKVVAV